MDEDDVKSIRSNRIKMEISGPSLEESMEECRVEEMSVHKVRAISGYNSTQLVLWLATEQFFTNYKILSLSRCFIISLVK